MKRVLLFAAVAEGATGLALLFVPSRVGQLLLGQEFTDITVPVARITGIALVALGVSCWPGPPLVGMLIYNAAVTLYLVTWDRAYCLEGRKGAGYYRYRNLDEQGRYSARHRLGQQRLSRI